MKREIKFGERSALLFVGENLAMLTTRETYLPVALADEINETQDVTVTEVTIMDNTEYIIRIVHDLPKGEVLNIVCDAISRVYDVDTSVSYARSENAV